MKNKNDLINALIIALWLLQWVFVELYFPAQ